MPAIFELHTIADLPVWAQVLLASRIARRAALAMRSLVPTEEIAIRLRACDLMEESARLGSSHRIFPEMKKSVNYDGVPAGIPLSNVLFWAVDTAHAAESTGDFAAAETALINSGRQTFEYAKAIPTMNPLQVAVCLAGDLDQLRFACKECSIGRYDPLSKDVFERLAPVYPPEIVESAPPKGEDAYR